MKTPLKLRDDISFLGSVPLEFMLKNRKFPRMTHEWNFSKYVTFPSYADISFHGIPYICVCKVPLAFLPNFKLPCKIDLIDGS